MFSEKKVERGGCDKIFTRKAKERWFKNMIPGYVLQRIEADVISRLNNGEKVYIESGAANDCLVSYEIKTLKTHVWQDYEERKVIFLTTGSIFPKKIHLSDFENIDTEIYKNELFLNVQ